MTAEDFGSKPAFPVNGHHGMDIRTWLIGMGLQGVLAAGRRPGRAEIMEELNPLVDAILGDLGDRVRQHGS